MTPEPGRFRRALRHPMLLFPIKVLLVAGPDDSDHRHRARHIALVTRDDRLT